MNLTFEKTDCTRKSAVLTAVLKMQAQAELHSDEFAAAIDWQMLGNFTNHNNTKNM
jgi:hypothetical protein